MSSPKDFLKDAVREKAERDLAALDTRRTAVDAIAQASADVAVLANLLAQATPAIASTAADAAAIARLKKLRRALDEARVHADDLALALDVEAQRSVLVEARQAIHAALRAAGIEPAGVDRSLAERPAAAAHEGAVASAA
jgi:hypothetical protein